MNNEVMEQICKELTYAESKYPNQILSKPDTLSKALAKLNMAYDDTPGCSVSCLGVCKECTDSKKFACQSFAAIAILIRGIESAMKENEKDFFASREGFFKKWFSKP